MNPDGTFIMLKDFVIEKGIQRKFKWFKMVECEVYWIDSYTISSPELEHVDSPERCNAGIVTYFEECLYRFEQLSYDLEKVNLYIKEKDE